jgi:hypothetical protein
LIVTPLAGQHMFRFQMIIDGQVIGDTDGCIIGSAVTGLTNLKQLEEPWLARVSTDPAAVLSILETDETLHDDTVLSIAESLDGWLICGYIYRGEATMLAQEIRGDDLVGPVLVSAVPMADYSAIVDAVRSYWLKNDELG